MANRVHPRDNSPSEITDSKPLPLSLPPQPEQ